MHAFDALPDRAGHGRLVRVVRRARLDAFAPEVDGPTCGSMPGRLDPAALDVVVVPGLALHAPTAAGSARAAATSTASCPACARTA